MERSESSSADLSKKCKFCKITNGELADYRVFDDHISIGILDHRPLFPGHVLLLPKDHYTTISDLPVNLIEPFFSNVRLISKAVEEAMGAQGILVAINNRVSQSVPHLHVHIVPRNKGDGLRGFFWPRQKYSGDEHKTEVQRKISEAISELLDEG